MTTLTAAAKALFNRGVYYAGRLGDVLEALETRIAATEGGALAAGSVATAELADDAVTADKLADDAVDVPGKIADDAVSLEHLDAGITPGLLVVAAGIFTTAGGDANETITVAAALGTDTVLVWVQKAGATPRTVDTITPAAGSIGLVLSGDPSTDHKLAYIVYRAPA